MRLRILVPLLVVSFLIHSSCTQDESVALMPVTTDSELALEFYETGMLAYDQVKWELAYHNLELAIKEDSDFFMAHFWMYFLSGKRSKEIAENALMVETELSDGEMQIRTAFKYLLDGQDMKVVEHLQNAIDLYPGDPDAHKILFILQFHYIKDLESAVKSIRRAIDACPDYSVAYNQLGYALMYLEEYEESEEAFDNYIRLAPNTANPYDSKGDYFMSTKQYDLAYESYMKAYDIDPTFRVSEKKALKAIGLYNSSKK
ncbi:MAG: tetratricopeptide repeat protein [Bacteroidetes bacterium]|nr:tetratricopeptide repeat protein [Bacteroidota bacterium]